jgi:GAF domain-containing protein
MTNDVADDILAELRNEVRLMRLMAVALRHLDRMQLAAQVVVRQAKQFTGAELSAVTLLHADHQQIIAGDGVEPGDTDWDHSYCHNLLVTPGVLSIEDTLLDSRVAMLPITQQDGFRSYLGAPLLADGYTIGSLCVVDRVTRRWTADEMIELQELADQLMRVDREAADESAKLILPGDNGF